MEQLSVKFHTMFNSVQMVVYIPKALVEEEGSSVGMNWHSDDEQYLFGPNREFIDDIAIATLNIFTSPEDKCWFFNMQQKGIYLSFVSLLF